MANSKKKHHFIPKMYLNGFHDTRDMIWVYCKNDIIEKHKPPYCRKAKEIAFVKNFYGTHREDGSLDTNAFEDALAEIVESPAADGLRALRAGQLPSFEQRQRLSLFFGYLYVRTPTYRRHYEGEHEQSLNNELMHLAYNPEYFKKWAEDYKRISTVPLCDDIEKLRTDILDGVFHVSISPNLSLYIMHKIASETAYLLPSMQWVLVKTHKPNYFLTSDHPVIITNPNCNGYYSPGLAIRDTRMYIPISKTIGLIMIRSDETSLNNKIIDRADLSNDFNKAIIATADKCIYANENNDKIKSLIKEIDSIKAVEFKADF